MNGFINPFLSAIGINMYNSHVRHHKETKMDQTLDDGFVEEGLVFNMFDLEVWLVFSTFLLFVYLTRSWFSPLPLPLLLFLSIFLGLFYFYSWSSIHSFYHQKYIPTNTPLTSNTTVYSPLPFYVPDHTSPIYQYLYWYHTLHHLNKGKSKGNYNIICPFADFVLMTYTPAVDNTKHFSENQQKTPQEEWLSQHLRFEIRILDNNQIEYRDEGKTEWLPIPQI